MKLIFATENRYNNFLGDEEFLKTCNPKNFMEKDSTSRFCVYLDMNKKTRMQTVFLRFADNENDKEVLVTKDTEKAWERYSRYNELSLKRLALHENKKDTTKRKIEDISNPDETKINQNTKRVKLTEKERTNTHYLGEEEQEEFIQKNRN